MSVGGRRYNVPLPVLIAACLGNGMEFYCVTVYAFVAVTLSKLFFPANRHEVSLLMTFGMFGLSYLARPVGGFILGGYADRKGRSASLMLSLKLMVTGTAIMTVTPTYARIGIVAPICQRSLKIDPFALS